MVVRMTPAARLAAAIEIVGLLRETNQPADRLMRDYFRTRRFAGSKDRRAIAERVFGLYRHRAHYAWRMGGDDPRRLAIASLLVEGASPDDYFIGGYGPAPLSEDERAVIAATPGPAPLWVEGEFPQFLQAELQRAFGDRLLTEMAAFQQRAPVDLRVSTLKAVRDDVLAQLRADGFVAEPTAHTRDGIRCQPGVSLTNHSLFETGAFEIQDEAAQMAVALAEAKPGMRVLDLAAGAGGKSLALAAAMQNRGEIIAADVRGPALAELERRAVRAGASIIKTHLLGDLPQGAFDLVFLDAPCSGSGTWRRQPEAKWRLTPARLAELMATQDGLLDLAANLAPRLIYATCSILPCENQDRAAAFAARHPQFSKLPNDFKASPAGTGTDGFYAAIFLRA
jgi:16S rRNA (cytosine967-C5)-methyltransferase